MPNKSTRSPEVEQGDDDVRDTGLLLARQWLAKAGDQPVIWYGYTPLSGSALDAASDALASALADQGVGRDARIVVQLQNMPQFVLAVVAAWKLAATVVPTNPMYRERELRLVLEDCRAHALITLEELWADIARPAAARARTPVCITTSGLDFLTSATPRQLSSATRLETPGALRLAEVLQASEGQSPVAASPSRDDVAFIVYTSGTTGRPKGAMNLHRNVAFSSSVFARWCSLTAADVNLGIAPLFHITGLIGGLGVSMLSGAPLVLGYRFDAPEALAMMQHHRVSYTVAAVTAFTALMNDPGFSQTDLSALRVVQSGGAPVSPAIAVRWHEATGTRLHNSYGMTETTSPAILVPIGSDAPVDPVSGALAVGVPVYDTVVEIHDENGQSLPPGEIGEFVVSGPQVVPGYWEREEENEITFADGRVRTGDVGFVDEEGWYYLVDRSKDVIIASGYKVWPREVEDVLSEHPAIRESAVVGVPDEYRGETVKAVVSLRAGSSVTEAEVIDFCRARLAAYKYPRIVTIVDELPKTITGKILRRALRADTPKP